MYSNTGYLHGFETEFIDIPMNETDRPLQIISCGVYRLIRKSYLTTSRPLGRQDYQLLYISKGKARFHFPGKEPLELEAGHMVLYPPFTPQLYSYDLKDRPEVYWLHFVGREAANLISGAGFSSGTHLFTGCSHDFDSLFLQMILELQQKRPLADRILPVLFQQLLYRIQRSLAEIRQPDQIRCPQVDQAVSWFHLHYAKEISIREFAEQHNVSTCWFIKSFKSQMGMTPLQYVTSLRIRKACELLESTSYTVQEIGELTGYGNPLYFSRIFKEKTGSAPRKYRTEHFL